MRRMWLAAVAAALLAGCTSDGDPEVAQVTIPVETVAVATTAPTTAAAAVTTVGLAAPTGATTVSPSAEDELRAATKAYWDEFRRTLLNLQSDDLSALSAWYASPEFAAAATAELRKTKARLSVYRDGTPPLFTVRVDEVAQRNGGWTVKACVADNMVEVHPSADGETVIDNSTAVNVFSFDWVLADGHWRVSGITERLRISDGSLCE